MLTENKPIFDYTGVTAWHEAGYTGKGIICATGERVGIEQAARYGYKVLYPLPQDKYPEQNDLEHAWPTAGTFFQVAPNATLVCLPSGTTVNGTSFIKDAIPIIKSLNISGMFVSLEDAASGQVAEYDSALEAVPNFMMIVSAGNSGGSYYNPGMDAKHIYGCGAFMLANTDDGLTPIPESFTSESDSVDFAGPDRVYVEDGSGATPHVGTSFASPYVLGQFTLVDQFFLEKCGRILSKAMKYQFFLDHYRDIGTPGKDTKSGWGAFILPDPSEIDIEKYCPQEESALDITKNLTTVNFTSYANRSIDYIVIHYCGALGSAEDTCAYFKSVNRSASAHYFVDDTGIWQCVEDANASWHCGDSGTGAYKAACSNANSIGIEVRPYKVNAASLGVSDTDWYFNDTTVGNLRALVRYLMDKHGIDLDHVIRHYDVTAKWCPRPWIGDDVNTYYGKTGNTLWAEFKASLEDDMTGEEIYTKMNEYLKDLPAPDWASAELQEAVAAGITDGTSPMLMIPRYQAALMAYRASKK